MKKLVGGRLGEIVTDFCAQVQHGFRVVSIKELSHL